jgi:hypothetical protein
MNFGIQNVVMQILNFFLVSRMAKRCRQDINLLFMYDDMCYFFGEKWLTFGMLARPPLLECMILGDFGGNPKFFFSNLWCNQGDDHPYFIMKKNIIFIKKIL